MGIDGDLEWTKRGNSPSSGWDSSPRAGSSPAWSPTLNLRSLEPPQVADRVALSAGFAVFAYAVPLVSTTQRATLNESAHLTSACSGQAPGAIVTEGRRDGPAARRPRRRDTAVAPAAEPQSR